MSSPRQSLAGKPAKSRWVESHTPSGSHGSHPSGALPVRANSGAASCTPSANASQTPAAYAATQAAVPASSRS